MTGANLKSFDYYTPLNFKFPLAGTPGLYDERIWNLGRDLMQIPYPYEEDCTLILHVSWSTPLIVDDWWGFSEDVLQI